MISTYSVVKDYFNYRLRNQTSTNNQLLPFVIKFASDCETKFRSRGERFCFNISSMLPITNAEDIHREIAIELFNNDNITWAHVISFISFSAILAEDIIRQQPQNEDLIIELCIDRTVNLIDSNLHLWLEQHHHWSGFFNTYRQRLKFNDSIFRYVTILTVVGAFTCAIWYASKN